MNGQTKRPLRGVRGRMGAGGSNREGETAMAGRLGKITVPLDAKGEDFATKARAEHPREPPGITIIGNAQAIARTRQQPAIGQDPWIRCSGGRGDSHRDWGQEPRALGI